ncbi:hypothetical protein [Chryseobacterium viscerum]|uniref:Uncharacterized protein n=1 Tax=Chryseobacterium viscerum TaxID=1037377 RepID=A0A316WI49_9FLAO|nr:hypothetical protein [Chryseobacterium viscerum]PWN58120.1 hypothetical protein C1634_024410 [Chryseobacterium viscerum]
MTIQEFKKHYYCAFEIDNNDSQFMVITSFVIRRSDNKIFDQVTTRLEFQKTNNWINDSQSIISVTPWSWDIIKEETLRAHLDFFALRGQIDNFYPRNSNLLLDINEIYEGTNLNNINN